MIISEQFNASPSELYKGNQKSGALKRTALTPAKFESIDDYGQNRASKVFDKQKQSVS